MNRLRRTPAARISFFSFQDIITSVTGVLILVTLILTLYLNPRPAEIRVPDPIGDRLASALDELSQISLENHALQSRIVIAEAAPDTNRLAADVARLREQHTRLIARLGTLDEQRRDHVARERELIRVFGVADRMEQVASLRRRVEALRATNHTLSRGIELLQAQTNDLASRLDLERDASRPIWLLPEPDESGKSPILVTVSGAQLTLERWNNPEARQEFAGAEADARFAGHLRSLDRSRDHLVFYVRPSGIALFKRCRATAMAAGFDVGHDAIEEAQEFLFRDPGSQ
jgi:hypothetical protein